MQLITADLSEKIIFKTKMNKDYPALGKFVKAPSNLIV